MSCIIPNPSAKELLLQGECLYSAGQASICLKDYLSMCMHLCRRSLTVASLFLSLLFVLCGLYLHSASASAVFCLAAAAAIPFLLRFIFRRIASRAYHRQALTQHEPVHYHFYGNGFMIQSSDFCSVVLYEDLYRIVEFPSYFCLMLSRKQVLFLEKSSCPQILAQLLRLGKFSSSIPRSRIILVFLLCFPVILTIFYQLIYAFAPQGCTPKVWVAVLIPVILILYIPPLLLGAILLCTGPASRLKSHMRIAARILIFLAALVSACCLIILSILVLPSEREICNENGTITVIRAVWLDDPIYSLYSNEGFFYRRYLRAARSSSDILPDSLSDSDFTSPSEPDDNAEQFSDSSSEKIFPDYFASSSGASLQEMRIQTGYESIHSQFLSGLTDLWQLQYTARGESYFLLLDSDDAVEFLQYDRDSANGLCGLYVHERCKKTDGIWSRTDAAIINIYAYEYATGTIAARGKTSWGDTAAQDYLELTGE